MGSGMWTVPKSPQEEENERLQRQAEEQTAQMNYEATKQRLEAQYGTSLPPMAQRELETSGGYGFMGMSNVMDPDPTRVTIPDQIPTDLDLGLPAEPDPSTMTVPSPPPTAEQLRQAEWGIWDQETAGRQWQPSQSIEQLRESAGLVVHDDDDDPANRYASRPDPEEHLPEAFKGKHYRGGQQITPNRGRGVGDAAKRYKGVGSSFTASRMAPPLTASYDYVQQNESPAIQALWKENRMTQLGIDMGQAELDTSRARADLLNAEAEEANLPYEQRIKRQFDGMMQMHDSMKERLMPNVQAMIDKQMTMLATDSEGMKLIDTPGKKKMVEESLRRRYENQTFQSMMGIIIQLVMAQDPAGAARVAQEMERQRMFGGGAGAMIPGATTP